MNQKASEEGREETRGELCFVCHPLLMRHMWEALETMSHAHNGTVATIGSEQAPSVRDDCVGVCYSTSDFSPVIEWLSTIYRRGLPFGDEMGLTMGEAHVHRCAPRLYWSVYLWSVIIRWAALHFRDATDTHVENRITKHVNRQSLPSFHLFLPSMIEFSFFSPAGWLTVKGLLITDFLSKMETRCSSTVK